MAIDWRACGGGSGGKFWWEALGRTWALRCGCGEVTVVAVLSVVRRAVVEDAAENVDVNAVAEVVHVVQVTVDSVTVVAEVMIEGVTVLPMVLRGCEVCAGASWSDHERCMVERRRREGRRESEDDGSAIREAK